ncbi:MAG: divalent-cation tolerance protein CutA [Snowella sp.]|jgi:periplasmic divalent cation tolerance protein|nr:MAG: divalent-cation tolerance protein CutA [Snowella sp.]
MDALNSTGYSVVLVTAASQAEATAIATMLIEEKLAACVNVFPVQSIYQWQGRIQQESEFQLIIKTNLAKFSELSSRIQEIHSYEVPEIIALPIVSGSESYLAWLSDILN